jgi:hypothetical protein
VAEKGIDDFDVFAESFNPFFCSPGVEASHYNSGVGGTTGSEP